MNSFRAVLVLGLGTGFAATSSAAITPTVFAARAVQYQQTSAAAPKLLTSLPYMFIAESDYVPKDRISALSVSLPTTGVFELEARNNGDDTYDDFQFQIRYQSLTSFNSAFPAGSYSISLIPDNGSTVKLALTVKTLAFPTTPMVTNYAACQAIDPTKAFTVTWNTFSGATSKDRILFGVTSNDDDYDFVLNGSPAGPVSTTTNLLAATTKSYAIPASSLPPGVDLTAQLIFVRGDVQASRTSPAAYYASGSGTLTRFKIHTSGSIDTVAPKVSSSVPKTNATAVANTSSVTITFDESMRTRQGWSVNFSNLDNGQPSVTWTNSQTLTVKAPAGGWPKGRKIGVILNPAGWSASIRDLSGNALAQTTISFTVKS